MSEIKWAYDENTGSFSALPASNFLLIAIGLTGLLPLFERVWWRRFTKPQPCPNIDLDLWNKYKTRYKILLNKRTNGEELTLLELLEYERIIHPPWGEPSETWTYPLD